MQQYFYSELNLQRAIWNENARKSILNKGISRAAEGLEDRLKRNIDESTPAGRLYTKRLLTERKTKANAFYRLKRGTTTRVVVGREMYRASARGQPPAKRFGTLYRNLKVRRVRGKLQMVASVKAPAVRYLDDEAYFNRPFFSNIVESYFYNEFQDEVRRIYQELLQRQ